MLRSTVNSVNQTAIKLSSARVLLTSKQDLFNNQINQQTVRHARNIKPWKNGPIEDWKNLVYNYSYRKARAKKVLKVELPDFDKYRQKDDMRASPDEIRTRLKERGIAPHRNWLEKPIYVGDTTKIVDEYVPPEGDAVASFISKKGAGQKVDKIKGKGKETWSVNRIRKYIDTFDPYGFAANEALDIYIRAHEALAKNDLDTLHTLVTDSCVSKMLFSADLKTIKWKFVKSHELPRVVNVKHQDQDGIAFGQVTVRFHSQQLLAIYDRFGRLVCGSEAILKDVLEYIVFENRISSIHGVWRIHGKIVPEWLKTNEFNTQTVVKSVDQTSST